MFSTCNLYPKIENSIRLRRLFSIMQICFFWANLLGLWVSYAPHLKLGGNWKLVTSYYISDLIIDSFNWRYNRLSQGLSALVRHRRSSTWYHTIGSLSTTFHIQIDNWTFSLALRYNGSSTNLVVKSVLLKSYFATKFRVEEHVSAIICAR